MSGLVVGWAMEQTTGSPFAKLILVKLAEHSDEQGYTHPGIPRIARDTEIAPSTIYKHLKHLKEVELVQSVKIMKTNKRGARYYVRGYRLPVPEFPRRGASVKDAPPHGKLRLRGGAPGLRGGAPSTEPSSEPSFTPPAFIAPPLKARVERLREIIGHSKFDAWFQNANFLDGPCIALPSPARLNWVQGKFSDAIREVFGQACLIRLASADELP